MPKTLFLLLDAFRGDYINPIDTPFLHAKSKEGIFASKLRSVAGFTQRTAIYSGSKGDKSGMFTMFTFDEEGSPFGFLRYDPRFARFANDSHWWDKLPRLPGFGRLKYHLRKKFRDVDRWDFIRSVDVEVKRRGAHAPLLSIPLFMLPEIGVSEDNKPIHLPRALSTETIFDVFVEERIPYDYAMFPVVVCEDDAVQQRVISQASGEAQVILGQLADSDACVHVCGPSSYERRKIMGEIDRKLREIAVAYPPDTTWIVIGDHGMTDVVEEVDVSALARKHATEAGAVEGRDYLVFLDSTMARFLWKTETGRKMEGRLRDDAQMKVKGRFIDKALAQEHAIPVGDRRYGDLLWWANLGVLIFPDYFHDLHTHNKGMHGYASDEHDMKGFFLAFGPGIAPRTIDEVNLIDVCPTICKAAGVRPPANNVGHCLI